MTSERRGLTLWKSDTDPHGERVEKTTSELFDWLSRATLCERKGGAGGWSPATFQEDRRKLARVETVNWLVLDCDADHRRSIEKVAHEVFAGCEVIVHATHRSTLQAPKWRAVFGLSRPVSPAEYVRLWSEVIAVVSPVVTLDVGAKDASRSWYRPTVPGGVRYEVAMNLGPGAVPLPVESLLARANERATQAAKARRRKPRKGRRGAPLSPYDAIENARCRIGAASEGERNQEVNRQAFIVASRTGLPVEVIVGELLPAAEGSGLARNESERTIRSGATAGLFTRGAK